MEGTETERAGSKSERNDRTHEMPAGTYFIGDPGYVIRDLDWTEYREAWREGREWKGHPIAAFSTGGDGGFPDNQGREYPVDSGCIAAVPIQHTRSSDLTPWNGHTVVFDKPFTCRMDREGRVHFGDIAIRTWIGGGMLG